MGNIALWKYSPPTTGRKVDGENKWKLQTPATVEGPVQQVHVSFMYEMFTCQCNKKIKSTHNNKYHMFMTETSS